MLVNFWASWCDPCRREAPELARFDRERPVGALLVGVDVRDSRSEALAFIRTYGWTFANVFDPEGRIGTAYDLVGLPMTVVVDAEGRIVARLLGAQTFETLVKASREASG